MPSCNGVDTGSDFARPEREQTSNGCPVVRTRKEPFSGRNANGRHERDVCIFRLYRMMAVRQYRKVMGSNTAHGGRPHKGLPFWMLEPCEAKVSRTVLRRPGAGNSPRLSGRTFSNEQPPLPSRGKWLIFIGACIFKRQLPSYLTIFICNANSVAPSPCCASFNHFLNPE